MSLYTDYIPRRSSDYVNMIVIDRDIDDEDVRLSLSYGFAQSVKLQYFETFQESLIEKYTPFIKNLSNKGEMYLSRNSIRQIIGEILVAKSEMNLVSNFLYHPRKRITEYWLVSSF